MTDEILNIEKLPDNTCFGCGNHNPRGLSVEIRRDPERDDRLVAHWTPTDDECGFPGLVHGGLLYTAMDCLAAWTVNLLRNEKDAFWILRSASVTYHHPAVPGKPIELNGVIEEAGEEWAPVHIRAEARKPDGTLLVDGTYKMLPIQPDRLKGAIGIDEIPDNWRQFLGGP